MESKDTIKDLLKIEESSPTREIDRIVWKKPNGKIHRKYGPAIIYDSGAEEWIMEGKGHREDGPSVIYPDGRVEYYYNGECVTESYYLEITSKRKRA